MTQRLDPLRQRRMTKDKQPKVVRKCLRLLILLSRYRKRLIGMVAINLALYAVLVVAYFLVVLRWLNEPLGRLFRQNLPHYALASVLLILGQGLLLDIVTSGLLWLARRISGKGQE